MQHTPGPWKIGPRIHAEMFASIFGADGQLIVNLGDGGNGIERQTANARLIAAAPELLEALKGITKMCNELAVLGYVHKDSGKPIEWSPDGVIGQAQAAITKAEGVANG